MTGEEQQLGKTASAAARKLLAIIVGVLVLCSASRWPPAPPQPKTSSELHPCF